LQIKKQGLVYSAKYRVYRPLFSGSCKKLDSMLYSKKNILGIVAICLLVILSYIPALNKPLVSDDYYWFSPSVTPYPWLLPLLLSLFPLILFAPIPLTIEQIRLHAESRLTYIPLLGFSILIGWSLEKLRRLPLGKIVIPTIASVFLSFCIFAQQVEIGRWNKAGKTAASYLDQIVTLVPNPQKNATFLFNCPHLMAVDRFYYVFGMGLKEALTERYERKDLTILQWPDEDLLLNPPQPSYKFGFNRSTLKIELQKLAKEK